MKRSRANANTLVLGEGPVANALAGVLNGVLVNRKADDAGWNWPRKRAAKMFSLVLVAPLGASASQIVRWHGEARQCRWIDDSRLLIVCLDESLSRKLPLRDVFGRSLDSGESFASWEKNIAIAEISQGLAGILKVLATLSALSLDTWKWRAEKASVLQELMRVLESKNTAALKGLMTKLGQQDWDAFCPHPHANRINRWLASVTDGVAPSWEEGRALFRPIMQTRK